MELIGTNVEDDQTTSAGDDSICGSRPDTNSVPGSDFFHQGEPVAMTRTIKGLLFALILSTLCCQRALANTYTAASCSETDVAKAVSQARDGDTVTIPACPLGVSWTSVLTVTKAINLLGSGQDKTVIIDGLSRAGCKGNSPIFMNVKSHLPWRLADFTLQGSAPDPGQCSQHIRVAGASHSFRIDDITFSNMQTTAIATNGDLWGVIDHCTFNGNRHLRGILIQHDQWQEVGGFGDNSWAQPDTMGTAQAVYVENCVFNIANPAGAGSVACQGGGRCVARYNQLQTLGTHGTESSGRQRGVRQFEVYNNTVRDLGNSITGAVMMVRGGTGLIFNNTVTTAFPANYPNLAALSIFRETDAFFPWGRAPSKYKGACDGTGPLDSNDGTIYAGGIVPSTGNSTTDYLVITPNPGWATNQWASATGWYSIRNLTEGWGASIKQNDDHTVTTYPKSQPGNITHTWNPGDQWQILKVYPCIDQPGRGVGDYLSGNGSAPPTPTGWPHEAIDPIYAWGNTRNGQPFYLHAFYNHVQPNRDYYDDRTGGVTTGLSSARPKTCTPLAAYWATDQNTLYQCSATNTWTVYYKPYTYPHPLTLGSLSPPKKD
jgi:hypothetical protein